MKDKLKPSSYEDFKDTQGRWRTVSLFWETRKPGYAPIYTMAEKGREIDGVFYPSLKEMYLKTEDPKEYYFVTEVMGTSWQHWKRLTSVAVLKDFFEELREELSLKLEARGVQKAIEMAENGSYQAVKLLVDKGWLEKGAAKKVANKKQQEASKQEDELFLAASFLNEQRVPQ